MADTQSMPALAKALSGVLPDGAVRQLMQALGNCNQPYTSRGVQNFQYPEQLGNSNGVYSGGQWNPSQYPGLLPSAGSGGQTEIPGPGGWQGGNYTGGGYNANNYAGNSFYFPTNQEFSLNNYYGGPIMNVGGNSTFNNITANNISVQSINVTGVGFPGFPVVPGEPQPFSPGTPGFNPGGGFGPNIGAFLGVLFPRPPADGGGVSRTISPLATVKLSIPTEGELTEDCNVKLKPGSARSYNVDVKPFSIREPR
jgi:hypothetical protein